jgi:hypothetical protein
MMSYSTESNNVEVLSFHDVLRFQCWCTGLERRVERHTVFIFNPEDGSSMFFRNVGTYIHEHGVTTQKTNTETTLKSANYFL